MSTYPHYPTNLTDEQCVFSNPCSLSPNDNPVDPDAHPSICGGSSMAFSMSTRQDASGA